MNVTMLLEAFRQYYHTTQAIVDSMTGWDQRQEEQKTEADSAQRDYLLEVLRATGNNRSKAARIIGISRNSLYKRIAKHNIRREDI